MKVYELDRDGGALLALLRERRDREAARSGLHVSTICNSLLASMYKGSRSVIPEASTIMFQEIGNLMEDVLAEQLARKLGWVKPAPRTSKSGITGSPDGYIPNAFGGTIDEVKATWVKDGPSFVEIDNMGGLVSESPKFYRYRIQATRYAHDDLFPARRIRLHVVFLCGTHRPIFPTPPRTFTLVLTDQDKDDNRALLDQHAKDAGLWQTRTNR